MNIEIEGKDPRAWLEDMRDATVGAPTTTETCARTYSGEGIRIYLSDALPQPMAPAKIVSKYKIEVLASWGKDPNNRGRYSFSCNARVRSYDDHFGLGSTESDRFSVSDFPDAVEKMPPLVRRALAANGRMDIVDWYFFENGIYHAGDADCYGLRAGEARQMRSAAGPMWRLEARRTADLPVTKIDTDGGDYVPLYALDTSIKSGARPEGSWTIEWAPVMQVGKGKERETSYVRNMLLLPDLQDSEIPVERPAITGWLMQQAPGAMRRVRALIEELGFVW